MLSLVPAAILLLSQASKPIEGAEGLTFLVGEWTSHETTKGRDGKEVPFDLKGKNAWILEGNFLQMDESFEVPGEGKFSNHILLSYDKAAKTYRAWWFASSNAKPLVFTGFRTEKTFVLSQEEGRLRISYDLLEDGHYKARLEGKRGDEWSLLTEAEYHRTRK